MPEKNKKKTHIEVIVNEFTESEGPGGYIGAVKITEFNRKGEISETREYEINKELTKERGDGYFYNHLKNGKAKDPVKLTWTSDADYLSDAFLMSNDKYFNNKNNEVIFDIKVKDKNGNITTNGDDSRGEYFQALSRSINGGSWSNQTLDYYIDEKSGKISKISIIKTAFSPPEDKSGFVEEKTSYIIDEKNNKVYVNYKDQTKNKKGEIKSQNFDLETIDLDRFDLTYILDKYSEDHSDGLMYVKPGYVSPDKFVKHVVGAQGNEIKRIEGEYCEGKGLIDFINDVKKDPALGKTIAVNEPKQTIDSDLVLNAQKIGKEIGAAFTEKDCGLGQTSSTLKKGYSLIT